MIFAHASLCFPQRRPEARVASALNELGRIAQQQGKLDDAEADFHRMADIYRSVYTGKHYYIGIAESNLADVYVEKKNYKEGERLFREALSMYGQSMYAQTLPPGHQLVGIARVRLGRAILRQRRYSEAESESRAGYELLMKQTNPPANWLSKARTDLEEEYDGLNKPEQAAKFRAELPGSSAKLANLASKK
jgi:tetratricopeptide (TPR) repeat protein